MRIFRDPQPPIEKTPGSPESMGLRIARASRQMPVATSRGKGIAMAVFGLIAIGGAVVTFATRESPASRTAPGTQEQGAREATPEVKTPKRPAGPEKQAPASGPVNAPAPASEDRAPDLAGLAAAAALASPEQRGAARLGALQVYGAFIDTPRTRRTILIDAARLAPDMTPEEEPTFAKLTKSAVEKALRSSDAAGAAVLYLGALRDRGGIDAVLALESVVLDEGQPLELRVAAAHVLPDEARLRVVRDLDARARDNPDLKDVPEQARRALTHPSLRAALR
jgi:hypothetical protein